MRLSELLGTAVVDSSGTPVGRVIDVRLVKDGPPIGTFGAALRISGLVISPRRRGSYLGYERSGVRGPWVVAAIVRRLHRGTVYAEWSQIAERGADLITLATTKSELIPPEIIGSGAGRAPGPR